MGGHLRFHYDDLRRRRRYGQEASLMPGLSAYYFFGLRIQPASLPIYDFHRLGGFAANHGRR